MEAVIKAAKAVLREELDKVEVHPCDYHDDTVRAGRLYGPYRELWDAITEQAKGQPAPVLAEALTATHGPLRLTNSKTRSVVERGYNIVGYVLLSVDGEEVCLSAESAVRWLPQAHYSRLMHEQDGSLFAQRTAGGDAYALCMLAAEAAYRDATGGKAMPADKVREIVKEVFAQPVAEAAAQADDERGLASMADIEAREAKRIDAMHKGVVGVLAAVKAEHLAAAPTAQPTPNEKGQPEGQPVSTTRFRTDVRAASVAQPTPPDDERAAFAEWFKSYHVGHLSEYEAVVARHGAWAAWQARAALRQPGALPDWIALDGDATIIHGVRYSNRLLEDFGKALPAGQPLLIESREPDGALCVVMLDWAVVDGPGALPDGAEDALLGGLDTYDRDYDGMLLRTDGHGDFVKVDDLRARAAAATKEK